jgi:hypothetical protein
MFQKNNLTTYSSDEKTVLPQGMRDTGVVYKSGSVSTSLRDVISDYFCSTILSLSM